MKKATIFSKKGGNQKGFSLIELLIVIAIMGVLAVIAYSAFNGVLVSSKRRADEQTALNIEKAVRTLITETGIVDIASTNKLLTTATATSATSFGTTKQGVEDLIKALQKSIYVTDRVGTKRQFGPYLSNPKGADSDATYESYAPQWTEENGGSHVGYKIEIWKSTNNVKVTPVTSATEAIMKIN